MRLKDEKGGCYGSSELAFTVPRASWREIFSWKRGFGTKGRKSLTSCAELAAASHFGNAARSYGSALRFKPGLELGIELVKAGFHPTGDIGPAPILERGDGDSQFEFDGILGLKVTTAVAADDF